MQNLRSQGCVNLVGGKPEQQGYQNSTTGMSLACTHQLVIDKLVFKILHDPLFEFIKERQDTTGCGCVCWICLGFIHVVKYIHQLESRGKNTLNARDRNQDLPEAKQYTKGRCCWWGKYSRFSTAYTQSFHDNPRYPRNVEGGAVFTGIDIPVNQNVTKQSPHALGKKICFQSQQALENNQAQGGDRREKRGTMGNNELAE